MPEFLQTMLTELKAQPVKYIVGYGAQAVFFSRFLVQWLASERKGRSVVPTAFWILSILGAGMLLSYAIWQRDQVIIVGQSTGVFIYFRNLVLVKREKDRKKGVD